MFVCVICNQSLGSKGISSHLRRKHNITNKDYYDKYLKNENEGVCPICGKNTAFYTILEGYATYCSTKCLNLDPITRSKIEKTNLERYGAKGNFGRTEISQKAIEHSQSNDAKQRRAKTNLKRYNAENPYASKLIIDKMKQNNLDKYGVEYSWQREDIKKKIEQTHIDKYGTKSHTQSIKFKQQQYLNKQQKYKQFEIDNNCTKRTEVVKLYGHGWIHKDSGIKITYLKYRGILFIKNEDVVLIKEYYEKGHTQSSFPEVSLSNYVKSIYDGTIIENTRLIINPCELDIYLPDLNLAIEYNGRYWHSYPRKSKSYHLDKSLACRKKGIRLIHIYEFEDFEKQKQLLKDLIEGKDNYPKQDFNKNNLLEKIPRSCIIYKKDYTIYGAGKLY